MCRWRAWFLYEIILKIHLNFLSYVLFLCINISHVVLSLSIYLSSVETQLKYTWAPQTVHNTPVMNILKGYFIEYFSKRNALKKPTSNFKFQIKWMDTEWQHSNLMCSTLKKVTWKISAQYAKACKRKVNCVFQVFKVPKGGITPTKNWRKLTTVEVDLYFS